MEYTSATMSAERGDTFDIVRRRAMEVISEPIDCGYSVLDVSSNFGLPGHSAYDQYSQWHIPHVLHSVVALPPMPHYLPFARKNVPLPTKRHHMISTPDLDTARRDQYLDLYHEVLVYLSASVMEGIGQMTDSEYKHHIDQLALLRAEDPMAIYTFMASDYEEPGVLAPDSIRIYVPNGYSFALAMRDLASEAKIGVSLN